MIKPIETIYEGYRFRSRLEARWAVFFNSAGIRYQYEPEGFEGLWGEKYLPDFFLSDFNIYAEVKPNIKKLLEDESKIASCIDFGATELSDTGLLILGQIPYWEINKNVPQYKSKIGEYDIPIPHFCFLTWNKGIVVDRAAFVAGYKDGFKFYQQNVTYEVSSAPDLPILDIGDDLWEMMPIEMESAILSYTTEESEKELLSAYKKARQARFEHGEKPL